MNDLMEKFYEGEGRDCTRRMFEDYLKQAEEWAIKLEKAAREQGFDCEELRKTCYNAKKAASEYRVADMSGMRLR